MTATVEVVLDVAGAATVDAVLEVAGAATVEVVLEVAGAATVEVVLEVAFDVAVDVPRHWRCQIFQLPVGNCRKTCLSVASWSFDPTGS